MKQNNLSRNPHQTLMLGVTVVLIMSCFFECEMIEFQWSETNYFVTPLQLALTFSVPLSIMMAVYWWLTQSKKHLTNWLTMGHIAFSLFSVLTLIFILCENQENLIGNPYDVVRYCL